MALGKSMIFGFFDSKDDGDDRYEYTSAEFSDYLYGLTGNGVSTLYLNRFETTLNGMDVTVDSGVAYMYGRYAENTAPETFTLTAISGTQQWTVCLEMNIQDRIINLAVKQGRLTAANSNTAEYYVYPLYYFTQSGGTTAALEDVRNYTYNPIETVNVLDSKIQAAKQDTESKIPHALSEMSGTLAISAGGTGATSASQARTNLGITPANIGASEATHNHSVNSLNNVFYGDAEPVNPTDGAIWFRYTPMA